MEEPRLKGFWTKTMDRVVESKALYAVMIISFALYLMTRSPPFALLFALSLIAEFLAETVRGAGKHGWKHELTELAIAIIAALAIWFGASFLLGTSAPLDAVVSCSMLPNLERGDMMVLQGAVPSAPEVTVSAAQWDSQDWGNETGLWCGFCNGQLCIGKPVNAVEYRDAQGKLLSYGVLVNETPQEGNLVKFGCGMCTVALDSGSTVQTPCAKNVTIGNTTLSENLSNEIIVYNALPTDAMRGDIIHRVYARINAGGKYHYLTKGDNNPQFDLQYGNLPAPQERTVGKTIFRIPYLGYVKLFLFGHIATPQGCDTRIVH